MNAPATASRPENRTESPDNAARKALARIHLDAGQHEAAAMVCGLILRSDPRDAEARRMMEEAMAQEAKLAENLYDRKGGPAVLLRSPQTTET